MAALAGKPIFFIPIAQVIELVPPRHAGSAGQSWPQSSALATMLGSLSKLIFRGINGGSDEFSPSLIGFAA